jgi:hypothetical protein
MTSRGSKDMYAMGRFKYIGFAALLLTLLATAFFGGVYVGNKHGTVSTMMVLDGIGALDNVTVLKMLERGNVDAAMKHLDLAIDEQVMELDGYRRSSYLITALDREQRNRSLIVLKTIAKDRETHPKRNSGNLPEVDQRVKSILNAVVSDRSMGAASTP